MRNNPQAPRKFVGTAKDGLTEVTNSHGAAVSPATNSIHPVFSGQTVPTATVSTKEFLATHREERAMRKAIDENRKAAKEEEARQQKMAILDSLSRTIAVELPDSTTVELSFPVHSFPQGAQRYIRGMASSFHVHESVPGTMLLGATSIISEGKLRAQRHSNHVEQGAAYFLIAMPSGKLKSPTLDAAMKPIKELEKELQELAVEGEKENRVKRRLLKKRIRQLEAKAAKDGEFAAAILEIGKLEECMPPDFVLPVFSLSKFTPEGLEKEAMRQEGRIAIVAAELGSFKKLQANKDDFLLVGYVGEDYVYLKSENPVVVRNPCVSIMIATQDKTAVKLLDDSDLQEDGLIARFLCVIPPDLAKSYPGGALTTEVPSEIAEWLDSTIRAIHAIPRPAEGYLTLEIDKAALGEWDGFAHHAKVQAETKDNSNVLKTFYRKLAGTALRLALFLHVLDCVERGISVDSEPIGNSAVKGGIQLAQFYEQHAKVALDIQSAESLRKAHTLLKELKERKELEIKVRDLYRKKKWLAEETMDALEILERHGYVALHRFENSVTCLVNPNIKHFR